MTLERQLLLVPVLLLLVLAPAITVFGADDSNTGNLTPNPTLNPQQLSAALNTLGQSVSDPNVQQLLNQFSSQVDSGNSAGSASTLLQLKSDAKNNPNLPDSLKALLQSLTVGQNGFMVDPGLLSVLLGANKPNANGVPSNIKNESPAQISVDLNTLANLLQYIDPNLASALLSASGQVNQGSGGQRISITPPGVNLNTFRLPTFSPPILASVGGGTLPVLNPVNIIIPVLVAIAVITLFFSRNRLGTMLGSQTIPSRNEVGEDEPDFGLSLSSPRARVILVFRRTVSLMRGRGVPKFRNETHREFSSKCSDRPEREHIGTIASLYEKALFSGEEVTPTDAILAEDEAHSLETPR